MKLNLNLVTVCMIFALGGMMLLNSCGDDEAAPVTFESNPVQFCLENPTDTRCFTVDPAAFCAEVPFDDQCCVPEYNNNCYCSTGDNGTTDTVNCCLYEFNPTCYCTANPDDSQCAQDFGVGDGLGLVIDFESGLESFAPDFFNPSGQVTFNGSDNVDAVEGDGYISLVFDADDPARDWHDFKYWPSAMDGDESTDGQALIDFTGMEQPTLNVWIHTEMDSMALTLDFQTSFEDGTTGEWAFHTALQTGTDNKWKLYSFDLTAMVAEGNYQSWGNTTNEFSLTAYNHQMIKFAIMAQNWAIKGDFTAHIDAISITDGPLDQHPWIE